MTCSIFSCRSMIQLDKKGEIDVAMLNATDFAKLRGVRAKTVADWFSKGYLPHATQDETTKIYSIPDDTPRPYKGSASVKKITSLIFKLLEAADLQQAVFPAMFPKLAQGTVDRTIEDLVGSGFIRIQTTPTGDHFLEITREGIAFQRSARENKNVFEKGLSYGKDVLSVVSTITTLV